jgi:hypothetical protein
MELQLRGHDHDASGVLVPFHRLRGKGDDDG